jgi:hypothetical protein
MELRARRGLSDVDTKKFYEGRAADAIFATLTSRTILPVPSTMQTLVSLTETSNPAKLFMLRFSF